MFGFCLFGGERYVIEKARGGINHFSLLPHIFKKDYGERSSVIHDADSIVIVDDDGGHSCVCGASVLGTLLVPWCQVRMIVLTFTDGKTDGQTG